MRRLVTAHPLGGCVMSDSPSTGVVSDRGEVWGYPGMYVADALIIPGPLAVNPSLTIAALAERITQWIVHGRRPGEHDDGGSFALGPTGEPQGSTR